VYVLNLPRGGGKTTACIRWARETDGTILVPTSSARDHVQHLAPGVDVQIAGWGKQKSRFVIDDLDWTLQMLLGSVPEFGTLTPDWLRGGGLPDDVWAAAALDLAREL
jgi:hypothetical protein